MEKRTTARMLAITECHRCNEEYFGTVVNVSEKGMLIRSQKIGLPLEIRFDLYIPVNEDLLKVPVKVIRMTKTSGYYDSIGVEVLSFCRKYLSYVNGLKLKG